MKRIVLLALVTYFLIAPFTYHPDTKLTLRYPALENGKVWDIYGYLYNHKLDIPDFHYPPAHYWWLKVHYPISKFIGGKGFDNWLAASSAQASFDVNALRFNMAAKLPLLVLGLLTGWIIFSIVNKATGDNEKGKLAALLWYFNPVTIYSLVIMGQNDIVAIFLFVLGMLFYEKWWLAALLWGLAGGVKSYPLIWVIIFLLIYEKRVVKFVIKTLSLLIVYGLILLPWITKSYFIQAVFNSGLSQRMFLANIPIGFDKQILIVPLLLTVLAIKAWKNNRNKMLQANALIFQSSLIILGFSFFNPQWMLWTIPFSAIWWSMSGMKKSDMMVGMVILIVWIGLILGFDDRYLTNGLLTPISPNLINYPSLFEFIRNKGGSLISVMNVCQSILAGIAVWYMMKTTRIGKNIKVFKIKNAFILIPWILVITSIVAFSMIKIEKVTYPILSDKEMVLKEIAGKKWTYPVGNNLKYFEISLDNPGLNSEDRGILVITDEKGESFEKEFSGFNAGGNSWLRVDLPLSMSMSKNITLDVKNIVIKDNLLKVRLDLQGRWAINLYNYGKPDSNELVAKLGNFWWWWILMVGASGYYIWVNKD